MPNVSQWKCTAIQNGAKISAETQVVRMNLRFSCGSIGEPGSPPRPVS